MKCNTVIDMDAATDIIYEMISLSQRDFKDWPKSGLFHYKLCKAKVDSWLTFCDLFCLDSEFVEYHETAFKLLLDRFIDDVPF